MKNDLWLQLCSEMAVITLYSCTSNAAEKSDNCSTPWPKGIHFILAFFNSFYPFPLAIIFSFSISLFINDPTPERISS
ncbi:unnamed protein product [Citrullus colocynthis]|uniref:Uncharacterized protein n=1 Tax=Citrullus colocynthis TaxID=252529 RepID=A0ABP0XZ09_9ROSI